MDVGTYIKNNRERLKLSQDELADKIFVTRQTISNWENDKNYPDIKSLSLLCNLFDVSLDDFIKGDIEKMKEEIDKNDIKKFNTLGIIFTIEMLIMLLSAYPLLHFMGIIGIITWSIIMIITIVTSLVVEKTKKKHNIHTYKEIVAFCEGKNLNKNELIEENVKRPYQRILLTICSALIAVLILFIFGLLF